jgi:hypothetical protein
MAQSLALNLTRNQIEAFTKNPETSKQIERLVQLVNFTGWGQSIEADEVLSAAGRTFAVTLPQGRFLIDLLVMVDVVGGSPSDGFSVTRAITTTIGAGSLVETVDDGTGALMFTAPNSAPVFLFSGAAQTQLSLRGFIEVQQPGIVGFTVVQTGAPTSATLLSGSGLTTNIQRGPPLV